MWSVGGGEDGILGGFLDVETGGEGFGAGAGEDDGAGGGGGGEVGEEGGKFVPHSVELLALETWADTGELEWIVTLL